MKEKIKVLMIGPDRDMNGGISTVVNNYYAAGIEDFAEITYLPTVSDGNKISKLWWAIRSNLSFTLKYRYYDLIHVHMAANASFARKALLVKKAFKASVPVLIQEHGGDFNQFYDKLDDKEKATVKKVFSMADMLIVLSEEWKQFFENIIGKTKKITVLHNGVIVPEKGIEDYHRHNVLYLGRLSEKKGIYDLLKVISSVKASVPDAHFYICGDGEMEQVKSEVERLGIQPYVTLPGWVRGAEKNEILSRCEILVLPSYYEAMPMVVLEAMSCGYAVIATDVGGIPQMIQSEKNGILIKPGELDRLAENIIEVLKNDWLRTQIGRSARQTVTDRFNIKKEIKNLARTYEKTLTNHGLKHQNDRQRLHINTFCLLKMLF